MCFLAVHLPSMSWPFANERFAGAFLRASIAHGDGMSVAPQPYQGPAKATGFVRRRLLNSEESHLPTWDKSKHPSSMRQIGHCESKWTSFALCIPQRYLQCHLCQFIREKTHYLSSWLRQEGIIFQSSGRSPLPSLGLQHHATSGGNKSLLVSKARYWFEILRISWHQLIGHIELSIIGYISMYECILICIYIYIYISYHVYHFCIQ